MSRIIEIVLSVLWTALFILLILFFAKTLHDLLFHFGRRVNF